MGQLTSRQELISSEVSNPLMRNWLCANLAVKEASSALAQYVHVKISQMHKEMQRSVGAMPACQINCSQQDVPWCATCERFVLGKWQRIQVHLVVEFCILGVLQIIKIWGIFYTAKI